MKRATILIIDDKTSNIYALENLLGKDNYTFFSANSGNEGLQIAFNKDVDLVILDVQMPDMDGFEVAQMLKSNKRTKGIPILFASAEKKEQKSIVKGLEGGAIDYLLKPLDPEVTKAKVAILLKLELQRKELLEKNAALEKSSILINNCSDIICTIDAETMVFEEINVAMSVILGYNPHEIKEHALPFFLSNDDREQIVLLKKSRKEKLSFETRIYCKDRSIKWLHWNIVVKSGKWFANARDITEIKQVEQIKNYLTTVVKQSNDAIYLHDNEGKIISWNQGAERIYGYSEEEALKMKLWNIIPQHLLHETEDVINKIVAGDRIESYETKRITKHGRMIDVLFSASILTDSDHNLKSIAITEQDITEQKIADEEIKRLNADLKANIQQLEYTNRELESFSYSVSHDLRAPLRILNGYTQMIEEDYKQSLAVDALDLFAKIRRNAIRMEVLIDDLLEFSKLGRKEVKKSSINTKDLVLSILSEIGTTSKNNATINISELPICFADYSLLKQVLINLISNALKYSSKKEKQQVDIGYYIDNNETIYFVKDNGAGFDMKYADRLFGAFQRLHSSSDFEGTGIGLAIVYRIITKHGGRIWADAKPDEGACFYFTIPN